MKHIDNAQFRLLHLLNNLQRRIHKYYLSFSSGINKVDQEVLVWHKSVKRDANGVRCITCIR